MLRKLEFLVLAALIPWVALLLLGEVSLRVYYHYRYGISLLSGANQGLYVSDKRAGWRVNEYLHFQTMEKDALGNKSIVNFNTYKNGFRSFGNVRNNHLKLFFLGDSYTAAFDVSDSKTYYGLLENAAGDVQIFAYGVPGYGTLQEYIAIDEYIDEIKPNYIIIQFCWNDFLDNNYNLDPMRTIYNGVFQRPYLDGHNGIVLRYPTYGSFFISLPQVISDNLSVLKLLNQKIGQIYSKFGMSYLEDIERSGMDHHDLRESVKITETILRMIKTRAKDTPVFLFCIPYKQPYYDAIKKICESLQIEFIDAVAQDLLKREQGNDMVTRLADRIHLNQEGHRVVFESLMRFFVEKGIIHSELNWHGEFGTFDTGA
jgi:hypothetical protein